MSGSNRGCCSGTCWIAIVLGILAGIAVGLLFYFGLIPLITVGVWIAFGLAVLTLILLTAIIIVAKYNPTTVLARCLCSNVVCLLVGIFGTIVSALIALSIVLTPGVVIPAVIVGLIAFFLVITLYSLGSLLYCLVCNSSRCSSEC